jgi:hypothetical protein
MECSMPGKTAADYRKDYTKPELRARLKKKIKAADKGGRKGQWSARKSQLLTREYEKEGGGYKHAGRRSQGQKNLEHWTAEQWQTRTGSARARHGKTTHRYLPKKAWDELPRSERKHTDERKRRSSRQGKQFVANTKAAQSARRHAREGSASKSELYEQAKRMNVSGRSKMNVEELRKAVAR